MLYPSSTKILFFFFSSSSSSSSSFLTTCRRKINDVFFFLSIFLSFSNHDFERCISIQLPYAELYRGHDENLHSRTTSWGTKVASPLRCEFNIKVDFQEGTRRRCVRCVQVCASILSVKTIPRNSFCIQCSQISDVLFFDTFGRCDIWLLNRIRPRCTQTRLSSGINVLSRRCDRRIKFTALR